MAKIHKNAALTPRQREEIHYAQGTMAELARKYNVHVNTIRKWKRRTDFNDRSSCRKRLSYSLSEFEQALICEVKKLTLFSIDDLVQLLKQFIPRINKDNVYKCLRRNGLNRNDLIVPREDKKEKYKRFQDYPPGYIHVDIKELPKINGVKKYLFVAIDRKTRICCIKVYMNQDAASAVDFLCYCRRFFPFPITTVLTDNGKCFTDRFVKGRTEPSGKHLFDVTCRQHGIEHRLTQPYTPKTNGMVERMNGRFNENVLDKYVFDTYDELEMKLMEYIYHYNHYIKQKSLAYMSPMEYFRRLQGGGLGTFQPHNQHCDMLHNLQRVDI